MFIILAKHLILFQMSDFACDRVFSTVKFFKELTSKRKTLLRYYLEHIYDSRFLDETRNNNLYYDEIALGLEYVFPYGVKESNIFVELTKKGYFKMFQMLVSSWDYFSFGGTYETYLKILESSIEYGNLDFTTFVLRQRSKIRSLGMLRRDYPEGQLLYEKALPVAMHNVNFECVNAILNICGTYPGELKDLLKLATKLSDVRIADAIIKKLQKMGVKDIVVHHVVLLNAYKPYNEDMIKLLLPYNVDAPIYLQTLDEDTRKKAITLFASIAWEDAKDLIENPPA
jgi:hypothetical protein